MCLIRECCTCTHTQREGEKEKACHRGQPVGFTEWFEESVRGISNFLERKLDFPQKLRIFSHSNQLKKVLGFKKCPRFCWFSWMSSIFYTFSSLGWRKFEYKISKNRDLDLEGRPLFSCSRIYTFFAHLILLDVDFNIHQVIFSFGAEVQKNIGKFSPFPFFGLA